MIKFFRHIRKQLLSENRFSKYLLYALGEIILVVIGILLALQINSWNQQRQMIKKEGQFLNEINENLNEDLQAIEKNLAFNQKKYEAIDSAFHYMALMEQDKRYGKQFSSLLPILSNGVYYSPSRIAFDGIVSTGQIEIIRSTSLRKQLARYYVDSSLDGVQEQLKINTQQFLDITTPKMINKEMTKFFTKRDFDVIDIEQLTLHNDPLILSKLFVMLNKTKEHDRRLNEMLQKIQTLQAAIQTYQNQP